MIVKSEIRLEDFEFWMDAKYMRDYVDHLDLWDKLEEILEEQYPDGIDETELNDLFWHEGDLVAQWLGYEDEEAMKKACEEDDE